ncbi:fungal-specific transcription factor domain-containing protein [Pisolithus thermaeus]|nr:fungal-specific transcription factor domain-containing protein [Pisolithus thermaeus]
MSSSQTEEDYNDSGNPTLPESKKRRVQRACDTCRRKKSDGSQMPGNKCSNCIACSLECTYLEAARKRGPPKGFTRLTLFAFSYVENLENRLEKMEKLLQKVCPDADFTQELGGGRIDRESWTKGITPTSNTSSALLTETSIEDFVQEDHEDSITSTLGEKFASLTVNPTFKRYFGKSSGPMLVQKAIDLKKEYNGDDLVGTDRPRQVLRPEFQTINPWEERAMKMADPEFEFPEDNLGLALVDLYFAHMNHLLPLLHRPTFERKLRDRLHLRDHAFGSVYLLVCANGSRYSDDPRVFLEGDFSHSAGWKYFEQVPVIRKTLLAPPALEDLQVYCLSSIYLQGTSAPQACWTIVGIGIRLAQDVGAHRRKVYNTSLTVEGELWKRAFWVLVTLDRVTSVSLGRPCAIQEEDFDIDLPVECDDEYWEHPDPELDFRQPENKPCTVSFFINYLKLYHIQAFALRTIYSISKHKVVFGCKGPQWEERVVAELDSALNKWVDAVPDHLRWDPNRDVSTPFFTQSCVLYASYYQLQILIHRPFIPSPRRPSVLSFPSLAICTNAARSCSHVLDTYNRRSSVPLPYLTMSAFTAGIRSGLSTDPVKEMADVHRCMAFLKMCEKRWHSAGRLWDVLFELASVGDLPPPQPSPTGGVKRERDSDSASPSSTHSSARSHDGPRVIAGSRRVHRTGSPTSRHCPVPVANLPVYSNDLGRLPIHGHVNFSMPSLHTHASHCHPDSSTGLWYPQHPIQHHAPLEHHVSSTEDPSAQPGMPGAGPYPPTLLLHGRSTSYPMNDHLYGDSTGGFTYDTPRRYPPSPPSGFYEGDGSGGDSTSGYPVDFDASNIHNHQGHAQHRPSPLQPPVLGQDVGGGSHVVDQDTIAMWSTAPSGFEVSDWGMYINNVSGVVGTHAPTSRHGH